MASKKVTVEQAKSSSEMIEKFIEENYGLIYEVVKRYCKFGQQDFEDYMQIASIGFVKAVRCFNNEFGTQFSTYAVPKMIGEIKRYIRDSKFSLKTPREYKAIYSRYKYLKNQGLYDTEISSELGLDNNQLDYVLSAFLPFSSIDYIVEDGEKSKTSLEELIETGIVCEEEAIYNLELEEKLEEIRQKYGDKYIKVINLRMQDKTQMEIAKKIGITQVEVSRILKRIREFFFQEKTAGKMDIVA